MIFDRTATRQRKALDRVPDPRPPLRGAIDPAFVVVPCHNEEDRLDPDRFVDFVAESVAIHILFVDDGSTDNTAAILDEMARRNEDLIHVLKLEQNIGKGNAVRFGIQRAIELGATLVAYIDADLATPLPEIERLIAIQRRAGFDVILGSRVAMLGHNIERSTSRHYLGRIFSSVASVALGFQVYDTQCGAKLFAVNPVLEHAVARPFQTRWVFDVELLARISTENPHILILEVPLRHWADVGGSKVKPMSMVGALIDLASLSRRLVRDRRARREAGLATITEDWEETAWNNRRRGSGRARAERYTGPDRRAYSNNGAGSAPQS